MLYATCSPMMDVKVQARNQGCQLSGYQGCQRSECQGCQWSGCQGCHQGQNLTPTIIADFCLMQKWGESVVAVLIQLRSWTLSYTANNKETLFWTDNSKETS